MIPDSVLYTPGNEPERIRKRLDTLFAKLDDAYPDKVICQLIKYHKKWAETVTELYKLLGYPDNRSFLAAYGYTVKDAEIKGGRPRLDYDGLISSIKERYPDGADFSTIDELLNANPDMRNGLAKLGQRCRDLYGITFKELLISLNIIKNSSAEKKQTDKEASLKLLKDFYIFLQAYFCRWQSLPEKADDIFGNKQTYPEFKKLVTNCELQLTDVKNEIARILFIDKAKEENGIRALMNNIDFDRLSEEA